MLDLDILMKYYSSLSPLPIFQSPAAPEQEAAAYYAQRLRVEEGCAGYLITDEFLFIGKVIQKETGLCLLLGPTTEHKLSFDATARIAREMRLGSSQTKALQRCLTDTPLMTLSDFLRNLAFLNYVINGNTDLFSYPLSAGGPVLQPQAEANETVFHNTSEFEDLVIQCIEYGQLDALRSALEEQALGNYNMGNVSSDSLRALKNVFVTSATLGCRAAVKGGLDYDLALSLSDAYIRQVENVYTYSAFAQLLREMLLELASRTAELKLNSNCSELIRNVSRTVCHRLYEKITVAQLAQDNHVSSSYLSHQFKRETGTSLTDYITRQKILEAQRLLETTDLSLAQISYQLAFSSQSYFHAVFKKVTGISPGKYPRSKQGHIIL